MNKVIKIWQIVSVEIIKSQVKDHLLHIYNYSINYAQVYLKLLYSKILKDQKNSKFKQQNFKLQIKIVTTAL